MFLIYNITYQLRKIADACPQLFKCNFFFKKLFGCNFDIHCHQHICIYGTLFVLFLLWPIPEAPFSSVLSNFTIFISNFLNFSEILSFLLNYPQSYKLDCCLTNTDAHVTGGSEDGFVYFWDLVDASVVSKFRAHTSVVKCFFNNLFILEESCGMIILKEHYRAFVN